LPVFSKISGYFGTSAGVNQALKKVIYHKMNEQEEKNCEDMTIGEAGNIAPT
jgi:hypothetical protein